MGMFDYIKCEHPLPDGFDPAPHEWQTKDLECQLLEYIITPDGRLVWKYDPGEGPDEVMGGELADFTGTITFYASNITGGSPSGVCTKNDEPPWSREYQALFVDGKIHRITGGLQDQGDNIKHLTRDEYESESAKWIAQREAAADAELQAARQAAIDAGYPPMDLLNGPIDGKKLTRMLWHLFALDRFYGSDIKLSDSVEITGCEIDGLRIRITTKDHRRPFSIRLNQNGPIE